MGRAALIALCVSGLGASASAQAPENLRVSLPSCPARIDAEALAALLELELPMSAVVVEWDGTAVCLDDAVVRVISIEPAVTWVVEVELRAELPPAAMARVLAIAIAEEVLRVGPPEVAPATAPTAPTTAREDPSEESTGPPVVEDTTPDPSGESAAEVVALPAETGDLATTTVESSRVATALRPRLDATLRGECAPTELVFALGGRLQVSMSFDATWGLRVEALTSWAQLAIRSDFRTLAAQVFVIRAAAALTGTFLRVPGVAGWLAARVELGLVVIDGNPFWQAVSPWCGVGLALGVDFDLVDEVGLVAEIDGTVVPSGPLTSGRNDGATVVLGLDLGLRVRL